MVYRLVCSLVYGMCIASGGFAAAQSADTVKEEPAVQTEDKNEAAASEPTQEANSITPKILYPNFLRLV